MGTKLKNVTFSLPVEVIEKFKNYANERYIPSINAAVREALENYLVNIEKQKLYKEMVEASKDSLFRKDMEETMKAFEFSDKEVLEKQEW